MIIDFDAYIIVPLNTRNAQHFRSLGYVIPTHKTWKNNGKPSVKRGTMLTVKVSDLPRGSGVEVNVRCDMCGKEMKRQYVNVQGKDPWYCLVCNGKIHKKEDSIFRTDKKCKCGILIRRNAKQCRKCWYEIVRSRKYLCVDCGAEITRRSKRCVKCSNTGINNPRYDPTVTDEYRAKKRSGVAGLDSWRKRCLSRDKYTCCRCGFVGSSCDGIIQVHHIENFKTAEEKRTLDENGATLCVDCHKRFHSKYGKLSNNLTQLIEFIGDNNV